MAKLIDTTPDKIRQTASDQHLFVFSGGRDDITLPIDAEYIVVYSPGGYNERWHAIRYRVAPTNSKKATAVQVIKDRDLTAEEIAHFEALIEGEG